MKTILFFAIFCLVITSIFSQTSINIDGSDMPKAGKIYRVQYDTNPQINIGTADSIHQTWNFGALNHNYLKVASYSSTAPYHYWKPNFPDANLFTYGPSFMFAGLAGGAPINQTMWGYMYWKSDNAGLSIVGWRGDYGFGNSNVTENPQELLMGAPASYDSSFTSNSKWAVKISHNTSGVDTMYGVNVKKILTVDAFGTIITPDTTVEVLRVHEYYIESDSVYTQNSFPLPNYGLVIKRDTLNNYYFWAKNIGYPVAIVRYDKTGLKQVEYLDSVINGYSITGQVFKHNSANPLTNGTASLIGRDPWDHLFGIDEEIPLDNTGHFQFANVIGAVNPFTSNWMIRAIPDTSQATEMPTYYGDKLYWNTASILHVTSDAAIQINCLGNDNAALNLGTGEISGTIYVDTSSIKTSLVASEKVTVLLLKGDSFICTKKTQTDHLGRFHFKNLSNSRYKLAVEIAGVIQDTTYDVHVLNKSNIGLDFYYDSTKVYLYSSIGIHRIVNYGTADVSIYPNPFGDKSTLLIANPYEKEFSYVLSVFDITGKNIINKQGKTTEKIEINRSNLNTGIYFFSLQLDGIIVSRGKLVVE